MEGCSIFLKRRDREALRERWLLRAGQAFERMFAEENQDQLVTFRQREDVAVLLSRELAAFLIEEHVAADVQVHPSDKRPPCCPRCEQPGRRVTAKEEPLPERSLTTGVGAIKLQREQWRCQKCRVVFFSAGPQAGVGDGRLQSQRPREGGAAGGQGAVVQGRQ